MWYVQLLYQNFVEFKHLQLLLSLLDGGKKYVTFDEWELHKLNIIESQFIYQTFEQIESAFKQIWSTNLHKPRQDNKKTDKAYKTHKLTEIPDRYTTVCWKSRNKIYMMNLHILHLIGIEESNVSEIYYYTLSNCRTTA